MQITKQCLSIQNNCLFFGNRLVVPNSLRNKVLEIIHFSHAGIAIRFRLFTRSYVWWPFLDNDLSNTISNCIICQSVQNKRNNQFRVPWSKSKGPWERVHCDPFDFKNTST